MGIDATVNNTDDQGGSQTTRAQMALRELVLSGTLPPGERLTELSMVDRIGVSRTPLRAAMQRLAEEGLLTSLPHGGYAVSEFSETEVAAAIEIRGVLEGLAARLAAERGIPYSSLAPIRTCLNEIDAVIENGHITAEGFAEYVRLNARFHQLLISLADSSALERQLERALTLPFASPSAFVMAQSTIPQSAKVLTIAQDQHRCVVEAIEAGEGARAESIMREHSRLAMRNLRYVRDAGEALTLVQGASLIKFSR